VSHAPDAFWSLPEDELFRRLASSPRGLSSADAAARRTRFGENRVRGRRPTDAIALLAAQFGNAIVFLLLAAAALSFALGQRVDSLIVLAIVLLSGLLGFFRERSAANAVERLLARVQVSATALRDGAAIEVPVHEIVPGDVVLLSAGDTVPGDCALLEARDLFVDEATFTGETFPVEKAPGAAPPDAPLARRQNMLLMGTHVVSGSARALVAATGASTELGRVAARLRLRPPETEFEHGLRRFGSLLLHLTLVLVIVIFAVNVYLERPPLDSLLFAVALAVGLTPQLLPAVVSVNLAHGARRMAAGGVIVKRLAAIEDFGSMEVLCTDKTGTLTEGAVRVHAALDLEGRESERVLFHAYLGAVHATGLHGPIDLAIRAHRAFDVARHRKLDEVPYDFGRKRSSVLVATEGGESLLVTKGALPSVLAACSEAEAAGGARVPIASVREAILRRFEALGAEGYRVLGIAARPLGPRTSATRGDEAEMTFLGSLVLFDPPKPGIAETVGALRRYGIELKIVTGDSAVVAAAMARRLDLPHPRVATGVALDGLSDEALLGAIERIDVVAEVEPRHKERVVRALRKAGRVVAFLGDGINDAPALHAAHVGISVDGAVDVAKDAADVVLLRRDLGVLGDGVVEGRRTFANTLKYVSMAASANFGNMFSMAGASLFLPFLPLLPKQVLLANLLTDLPEMAIAGDAVDEEMTARPRRFEIGVIRRFMMVFGLVSSVFDYLTFAALLLVLRAPAAEFRTGWFVESVVSATLIVLVVRTRRPAWKSRPARLLLLATLAVVAATVLLPFSPLRGIFEFAPLPPLSGAVLAGIVALYAAAAEVAKRIFYRPAARRLPARS
jgi:Mg2+-importing ATPase